MMAIQLQTFPEEAVFLDAAWSSSLMSLFDESSLERQYYSLLLNIPCHVNTASP